MNSWPRWPAIGLGSAALYWLSREIGVTPVPGSSFFREGGTQRSLVRFVFCKTDEVLAEAAGRLAALADGGVGEGRRGRAEAGSRSGWQR